MRLGEENERLGSKSSDEPGRRLGMVRQVLRLCLSGERVVTLPCLGDLILRPSVLDGDADWLANVRGVSWELTSIECAGLKATLEVERGFALHIVNTLTGCGAALASGPLSRIERGLLQGALAGLVARLHLPPEVRVSVEAPAPTRDALVIQVLLTLGVLSGRAWVCASTDFLLRYLEVESVSEGDDSRAVRLELGRTHVPCSDLNAVDSGDLVVFEEVRAFSMDGGWPVQLRRGDASVPASLSPEGALVLARAVDSEDKSACATLVDGKGRLGEVWPVGEKAGARDEIVAELGCLQFPALVAYLRGESMHVERARRILLRRDGVAWAEGELLAFEGALAVRITRQSAG